MAVNLNSFEGNTIMSRIRLARNVKNYPFRITNENLGKDLVKKVYPCRLHAYAS